VCYQKRALDLAFRLFYENVETLDFKALRAFEIAGQKCGRLAEVVKRYETLVPTQKKLYGRLGRLRKEMEKEHS